MAALQITAPYSFGFEDYEEDELSNWVLNPGTQAPNCKDQWVVGEARANDGHRSLYISCDGGVSAEFGTKSNLQYAYRDFTIPAGGYDISFDWSCKGDKNNTELYAAVVPASTVSKYTLASSTGGVIPTTVLTWVTGSSGTKALQGEMGWSNASVSVTCKANTTYRLLFVWRNTNTDTTFINRMAACVDNIQITSSRCKKPKMVTVDASCDTVLVNWEGSSTEYCLEYRRRGAKRWVVTTGIQRENYILEGLDEGMYDFRVRGVCSPDTSAYTYANGKMVFCPDRHCVNYVNLEDSINTVCTYGTFQDPYKSKGAVRGEDPSLDYQNKFARHTVVWEPGLYDVRTKNQLPLIPDGELASIRLGNWNIGAEAESVTYTYVADLSTAAILLLKYAVVMEDPNHGASAQPRFTMEILDDSGQLISPTCGAADFVADASRKDPTWHTCSGSSGIVTWKEWTTVGLNLEEVGVKTGDVLHIRLTTRDCSASGHYGYAYFTLGCAAAQISGTSCGEESQVSVSAPNGFKYEWYNEAGEMVSTNRELSVESWDIQTYRCHLISTENEECDFNLYTKVRPRYPFAEFSYTYDPADCQNRVRFFNKSHVITKEGDVFVHHYDELCDEHEWDFGTGTISADRNPVIAFPQEGGEFDVTLTASISEGVCVDDTIIRISIPKIGPTSDTIYRTICDGSYTQFGPYYAALPGDYPVVTKSRAGCDSTMVLHLSINPVNSLQVSDTTICAEDSLTVDGKTYPHKESGKFYRFYVNTFGCDSTVWCNVTVLDSVKPIVEMIDVEGGRQNSGEFYLSGSGYTAYTITHDGKSETHTAAETHLTGFNGGEFVFEFYNELSCSVLHTEYMSMPCRSLIFQRWGDLLSVLNSDSIGGLQFTNFQWLKNDVEIPGATMSYYYEPNGLDLSAQYAIRVTTADTTFTSCPFAPVVYNAPAPTATKRIVGNRLIIENNGAQYNALGVKIKEED